MLSFIKLHILYEFQHFPKYWQEIRNICIFKNEFPSGFKWLRNIQIYMSHPLKLILYIFFSKSLFSMKRHWNYIWPTHFTRSTLRLLKSANCFQSHGSETTIRIFSLETHCKIVIKRKRNQQVTNIMKKAEIYRKTMVFYFSKYTSHKE